MKLLSTIALLLLISSVSFAQEKADLSFEKNRILRDGIAVSNQHAAELMANYPEATDYMKKARANITWGMIVAGTGGYFIGYPIGQAIAGGDANWELAAVGVGVLLLSLPFNSAYKKNASKAVELYNASDYRSLNHNINLNLGLIGNGIGVQLTF